jgi:hypothetical protein
VPPTDRQGQEEHVRYQLAIAGAVLGTLLVSGCSAGKSASVNADHQPTPSPQVSLIPGVTATPQVADVEQVMLPVTAYMETTPQLSQGQQAVFVLARQCMSRFAIQLPPPPPQRYPDVGQFGMKRRYGITPSLDYAQKYGYHMAFDDPRAPQLSTDDWPGSLPLTQREIYHGDGPNGPLSQVNGASVPKGGCLGEANGKFAGTFKVGDAPIVDQVKRDSFGYSQLDPRVIAAQSQWSDCMKGEGYQYKTSLDALSQASSNTPTATSNEISVAVASYNCAQKANLVGIWSAVETAYQKHQIDLHAEEFAQAKQSMQQQLENTTRILSGAGQ